jgi:hypothetical protein
MGAYSHVTIVIEEHHYTSIMTHLAGYFWTA